jgi:hypothetical protein
MDDYQKWVRPVINASQPLEVKFGMTLQGIIHVVSHLVKLELAEFARELLLLLSLPVFF